MSSALYTVIGAFVGVVVTQIANYFLEDKKSKNQIALKKIELDKNRAHELEKSRREVYARYLRKIEDFTISRFPNEDGSVNEIDLSPVMDDYYMALILGGEDVNYHVNGVLEMARRNPFDQSMYKTAKSKLLEAMKAELQQGI